MENKKSYHIRFHKVEGDVREVLTELVQEKIKCALSAYGRYSYYFYDFPVSNYITEGKDDAESGNLCSCQHEKSIAEGQS